MSQSGRGLVCQSYWSSLTTAPPYSWLMSQAWCLPECCADSWVQIVYLKWSMWQCIETESVSCVCGAGSGSGSDGPEHTAAVAEAETDDVDPAEVVSQCEAGSDLTPVLSPPPPVTG